jgi:hypothetical protein
VTAEVVKYIIGIAAVLILFVAFGLYTRACDRL